MSDFVQRVAAGSTSHRISGRERRAAPRPTSSDEEESAVVVDGKTLYRARGSDGRTVLVDSELRKDIIEAAARLASGH